MRTTTAMIEYNTGHGDVKRTQRGRHSTVRRPVGRPGDTDGRSSEQRGRRTIVAFGVMRMYRGAREFDGTCRHTFASLLRRTAAGTTTTMMASAVLTPGLDARADQLRALLVAPETLRYWARNTRALPPRHWLDLAVAEHFYRWHQCLGRSEPWPRTTHAGHLVALRAAAEAASEEINRTPWHSPGDWFTQGDEGRVLRQACAIFLGCALRHDEDDDGELVYRLATPLALPDASRLGTLSATLIYRHWPLVAEEKKQHSSSSSSSTGTERGAAAPVSGFDALAEALSADNARLDAVLAALPADADAATVREAYVRSGFHLRLWLGALTNYLMHDPKELLWKTLASDSAADSSDDSDNDDSGAMAWTASPRGVSATAPILIDDSSSSPVSNDSSPGMQPRKRARTLSPLQTI